MTAGSSTADAYVLLGEPDRVRGAELVWHYGATDTGFIVATTSNERIASINCHVAEWP